MDSKLTLLGTWIQDRYLVAVKRSVQFCTSTRGGILAAKLDIYLAHNGLS